MDLALTEPPKVQLFCSYSHKDEELRAQFDSHVAILRRKKWVDIWTDRKIVAGDDWEPQIQSHLEASDIVVMLISSDFVNSDYCYGKEMTRAMERSEAQQTRVVPVIVRPCLWEDAPFAAVQALPPEARPVTLWPNRDEAWAQVATGLKVVVLDVLKQIEAKARFKEISKSIAMYAQKKKSERSITLDSLRNKIFELQSEIDVPSEAFGQLKLKRASNAFDLMGKYIQGDKE